MKANWYCIALSVDRVGVPYKLPKRKVFHYWLISFKACPNLLSLSDENLEAVCRSLFNLRHRLKKQLGLFWWHHKSGLTTPNIGTHTRVHARTHTQEACQLTYRKRVAAREIMMWEWWTRRHLHVIWYNPRSLHVGPPNATSTRLQPWQIKQLQIHKPPLLQDTVRRRPYNAGAFNDCHPCGWGI